MRQHLQHIIQNVLTWLFVAFTFILLLCSVPLLGQNTSWEFNNLTTKKGLSHSDVVCFCQDYEGFMWIGTANGLNRYNGADVRVYKQSFSNSASLPGNYINEIFEDLTHTLWIFAGDSLVKYNRDQDNFERFKSTSNYYPNAINTIFDLDSTTLLIATRIGCYVLNKKDNSVYPFTTPYFTSDYRLDFNIITSDAQGNIWISCIDRKHSRGEQGKGGLYKINTSTNEITHFNTEHPVINLKENQVNSLFINNNDEIWVGYQSKGVDVFTEESGRIASYINNPNNPNSLSSNTVVSIKKDQSGHMLFGTGTGGLSVLNLNSSSFDIYKNTASERSLVSNSVTDVFIGKEGVLWIGCVSGGVSVYDERFDKFVLYNSDKLDKTRNLLSKITCFTEDLDSNIWIASDGGGIHFYNPKKGTFTHFTSYLQNNKVLSVLADENHGLWVGTWGEGLCYFTIQQDQLKFEKSITTFGKSEKEIKNIFTLFIDNKGTLWVGTFGYGLWFYNSKKQLFERAEVNSPANKNEWLTIRSIIQDSEGYLWLATEINGLYRYDPETNKSISFQQSNTVAEGIKSDYLNFVFEDSKKRIWIGYNDYGLGLYHRENNTFYNYYTKQGLPDNTVVGMLEDKNGEFWISTYNGLSHVLIDSLDVPELLQCTNYTVSDGLQDKIFNRWAYFKSRNGQLYFGGPSGFNVFYPSMQKVNNVPPPVYLTDFQINRQSVSLKKHISQTNEIILKYSHSEITFKFNAINFIHNSKNQYAYYLEGFDTEEWKNVSNSKEATYTNIPKGNYTFKVKASNNDGVWNEVGTSVSLIILPLWWQTTWFIILVVIFVIGLLVAFYFYRIMHLKTQKKELEFEVRKRTTELSEVNTLLEERQQNVEEQAEELMAQAEIMEVAIDDLKVSNATKDKFFSIIAHDLKNPFSSILGLSELLVQRGEKMDRKRLPLILQNLHISAKRVYSLLENLLQWSRAQTGKIEVKPEEINLLKIVKSNIQLTIDTAREKGLGVDVDVPESLSIYADPNLMNAVIRNLLTNAIKFTEKGSVSVYAKPSKTGVELFVKDSGVGIPPEKLVRLFRIDKNSSTPGTKGESGTGLGLLICKEFIELNNGELSVMSEVNKGSIFKMKLPNTAPSTAR